MINIFHLVLCTDWPLYWIIDSVPKSGELGIYRTYTDIISEMYYELGICVSSHRV